MHTRSLPDPTTIRTRQDFGATLTQVRESTGLTIRDIAKATGQSVSTLGGYFSGKHVPPLKPLTALGEILAARQLSHSA